MADNGKTARSGGRESLRKVSISRIKKEMSDVFYLSDDLVISALTADKNTTADYPTSIDGFTAIIMMTGEATVSIGGARNAGLLAARIVGVGDPSVQARMREFQDGLRLVAIEKGRVLSERRGRNEESNS